MKRRTKQAIIFWSLLTTSGILLVVLGIILPIPSAIVWSVSCALWGATLIWIALHFALSGKPKATGPAKFTGNQAVFDKVLRESNEALQRYTSSVRRKGLFKSSALYERPWLMLCGTPKAGKTELLYGSQVDFPVRYPTEKDGLQVEGLPQISWHFGNKSVWVDTPGQFMTDAGSDEWRAMIAAFQKARARKPVDGMALVISAAEVLNAEPVEIKNLARTMRSRIDELISSWGIEFPVYLVFSRADEVAGFDEFFAGIEAAPDQVCGATLSRKQQNMMPRFAFAEEFSLLASSLADQRMQALSKEHDPAKKRLMCRFVIHFTEMQEKLASFVSELFKPSSYEGKPIFSGFYFTSVRPTGGKETEVVTPAPDFSNTIANHPLNPKKIRVGDTASGKVPTKDGVKPVKAFFVRPLFGQVMLGSTGQVKRTHRRSRQDMLRHYGIATGIVAMAALILVFLFNSSGRSHRLMDSVAKVMKESGKANTNSLTEAYDRYGRIGAIMTEMQRYEDDGVPIFMRGGFYKGRQILHKLKPEFVSLTRRLVLKPSVGYLEYKIRSYTDSFGELSSADHSALYTALKAYLSMSEAVSDKYEQIDTSFLKPVLVEAATKAILKNQGRNRLSEDMEITLNQNIGLYLAYLKTKQFPLMQENQRLALSARRRLQRLPDARNLYETVANKLGQQAPTMTLDDLLGRTGEGLLKSTNTISMIYTQEGFERYVKDAIAEASVNPFKIDWVMGAASKSDMKEMPDPKRLQYGMTQAYFDDFGQKWLGFVASVKMDPFGDIERCARLLKKICGNQSEVVTLLEAVGDYTIVTQDSDIEGVGKKAIGAAGKFKKTRKLANKAGKIDRALPDIPSRRKDASEALTDLFDPLRSFARSTGSSLGGFDGYKDRLLTLAEKLAAAESGGDNQIVATFNGTDNDPLFSSWTYTSTYLDGVSEELKGALGDILMQPITHTGTAVSRVLTVRLNERWQNEIVSPFTSRCAGRYPFTTHGGEASFSDVMDFFRPNTGTFWGFYEQTLSPFIVKTGRVWSPRSLGSLTINFNPEIATSLLSAERITKMFFKPDGTVRTLDITLTPSSQNKYAATLQVGPQTAELKPGGTSGKIRWPLQDGQQDALLSIHVSDDFTQDMSYPGPWGFMKLLRAARINSMNETTVTAKWQANVQNMYMAQVTCRVQVAGSDHPFSDPVFGDFVCPENLTTAESKEMTTVGGMEY